MKSLCRLAISVVLFGLAVFSTANDELSIADELKERLDAIDRVTSSFVQEIDDGRGRIVEESSGQLYLEKPNFRWVVDDPYPQIIVARGAYIEIYDPDLEQLTRKTIGNSIEAAPITLLTNPGLELREHFVVQALETEEPDTAHYVLTPTSVESLFASLELVFAGKTLQRLVIYDHGGQKTRVQFVNFRTDQVIQSELFQLDPPLATDVVEG